MRLSDAMLHFRPLRTGSDLSDESRDLALVSAVKRGDARAVARFYERVRPVIDRKVRRLLGTHDADYDDMVQNSLIELIRSLDRFRGDGSLDGWVSVVAARVVYRELRERRSERRVFDPSSMDDGSEAAGCEDGESATAARELLVRVRRHLDALDPVKAWTYLLHDVLGHSLAEVAEITSTSVSAAQSRLFRGRRDLEERLAGDADLASLLRAAPERSR